MNVRVQVKQWGNSKAVRLPKDFTNSMNLDDGDFLELVKLDEQTIKLMIIPNKPKPPKKRLSLAERIAMTSVETLPTDSEWDLLEPTGQEI